MGEFFTDEETAGTVAAPGVFFVKFTAVIAALVVDGGTDETCVDPVFDLFVHF